MSTLLGRDEFEAAVTANPTDPSLRLVFADWLEERGLGQNARQERWLASALVGNVGEEIAVFTRNGLAQLRPEIIGNPGYWRNQAARIFEDQQDVLVVVVSGNAPTHSGFRFDEKSPIVFYRRHSGLARRRTTVRRVRVA